MASSGELPPAKRDQISATAPNSFDRLPDDIEINILQSLPSLPSLVRAACTCRRWRDLASDPDFRRRFRTNHPPPVLGLFFDPTRYTTPATPSFAPVRRDDADLAKVILQGDFFLTPLYVSPQLAPPTWLVADSRCGKLLLWDCGALRFALVNPLEKRVEGYFEMTELDIRNDGPHDQFLYPRLICFDEFPSRFWIYFLHHGERRVQVGMFSHNMRKGMLLPWMDAPGRPNPNPAEDHEDWLHEDGMVAGLFIYWLYKDYSHAIILDTTAEGLRCYAEEIPPCVHEANAEYYVLGEDVVATEDPYSSVPYIVYVSRGTNTVYRLTLTGGAPGSLSGAWVREVVNDLGPDIESLFADLRMPLPEVGDRLAISELKDGFAYFTTSHLGENVASWFCSLSLETGQVERLLWRTYDARFQPYTMPWPRFLLGDQDDDEVTECCCCVECPSDSSQENSGSGQDGQDGPASSQEMEDGTWCDL